MAKSKKNQAPQLKARSTKKTAVAPDSPLLVRPPWARTPVGPLVLSDLRVMNALPPVTNGQPNLMDISELYAEGVQCEIDMWIEILPFGNDGLEVFINNVLYGSRIPFSKPLSAHTWPYRFSIPEEDIGEHGLKNLTYEVFSSNGSTDGPAAPTPVTIDRRDPNAGIRPGSVTLPSWVGNFVTLQDLDANGGAMVIEVPRRLDPQVGDKLEIYTEFPSDTPSLTIDDLPRTTAPVMVSLTKALLEASGGGVKQLNYVYTDRAGNPTSYPSSFREFTLVTEDLPENLRDPECPEAPLDLLDAQLNRAEIWIREYDNALAGDRVLVEFNTLLLVGIVNMVWPLRVTIPWDVLRDGGLDAPYEADVLYNIDRGGVITGPSDTITVDVDLRSAGGRPEDPGPVNPDLDPVEVTSSEGLTNQIGPGDMDDATARFDVYTGATAGHLIQLWWKGLPCYDPPYEVTLADESATEFVLTVPAAVIKDAGNGDIPTWYTLNNGANDNVIDSVETTVSVSAFAVDNLLPINYPDGLSFGDGRFALTCAQGIPSGIRTVIKDPANLRTGDRITLHWVIFGPDDFESTVITVDEAFPSVTITHNHDNPGHPGELFTVPFPTYIQPVLVGRIEATYHVLKADGVTEGNSPATIVLMTRRQTDGTICG